MRPISVHIQRFRSARDLTIGDLGNFNVLIGKNNAGKSTALTAIWAFFGSLAGGTLINLEPRVGGKLDHFNSESAKPIELSVTFELTAPEIEDLRGDIAEGTPQLEEVAKDFSSEDLLRITVCATAHPGRFSYVAGVELLRPSASPKVLLQVGRTAANEMRENAVAERQLGEDQAIIRDLLSKLDESQWRAYKNAGPPSPLRYWGERGSTRISAEISQQINDLWLGLDSFDAFKSEIATIEVNLAASAVDIARRDLKRPIRVFGGDEHQVPEYVSKLLARVGDMKVHYLTERREPIGRAEAQQLLELKVRRGGIERLQEIQTAVYGLLGVKLDAFEADGRPSRSGSAEMDVDDFLVQVNGAGIREALRIVLDVEFGQPDILLVEEPEIHLHPAMETSLMQYLKRIGLGTQVFVSTHSTNFLDVAEMRNVYLVSKEDHETSIQLLSASEAEASIPRELGVRLSSLFMFDRLAFVEGPTDEAVIREWATTLGVNLSYANVGFISMGGARSFAYFAAERTLDFLGRRQVDIWFVIDRDERDDDEVTRMTGLAGDKATVVVLSRRELENYLVAPRPLALLIGQKRAAAGKSEVEISQAAVSSALEKAAEGLKTLAIRKRVEGIIGRPLYWPRGSDHDEPLETVVSKALNEMQDQLVSRIGSVESVISTATEEVDRAWDVDKLKLVPGDELLDLTFNEWEVRYRKERGDGARLAALMSEDEIADEIKDLLENLGA
jgi:putative ATP-dependent endonuclease of the OLD family